MLKITVGSTEMFDEEKQAFTSQGGVELTLEHSLASVSKWEQIFEKPFLSNESKDEQEILAYVKCMVVGDIPPGDFLQDLDADNFEAINEYMNRKMTATWFSEKGGRGRSSEVITSELIYYWMTALGIPFECEHWHLNRLMTLIRIANAKQQKPKPMSKAEIARHNRELNEQRKARLGTKG